MTEVYQLDKAELVKLHRQHVWLHLTNHKIFEQQEPFIIVEGKGCYVKDIDGNEYLDALSGGVWCVNTGYGRESIAKAVHDQLLKLAYYAGTTATPPYILLAAKLSSLTGLPKVYFSNSGSEANEKAFKLARQYFRKKYPNKNKYKIVYRYRDYHGTTFGAMSATGQPERRLGYEPLLDGFLEIPHACCYRCEFNKTYPSCDIDCARALENLIKKEGPEVIAAVIVEPITAGGGIIPPVKEYYQILQEICKKYEILLIMDEVVNGFGRTGKMFGFQHYDILPDMITVAKGITSAYVPLSATLASKEIFEEFLVDLSDKLGYFRDISTYGGCTAGFVAALENIRIIEEEKLVENSAKMGEYLLGQLKELESLPIVGEVRGRGLLVGIEIVTDKKNKEPANEELVARIVAEVKKQGVLVGRMNRSIPALNNVVTIAPPLIVSKDDIDRIVVALRNAFLRNM